MNETMMLFVSLPSRAVSFTIPMSYIYLSAWLEKKGIPSGIVDVKRVKRPGGRPIFSIEQTLEKILAEIESRRPKYIGFTCYTSDYNSIIEIGTLIKKRVDAKIIVGGPHPTLRPEDFFVKGSPVDFVVKGEGEVTLSELIEKDSKSLGLDGVAGIMYKNGNSIVRTADRPYMADLGELPLPAYDKINMNFYAIPQQGLVRWLFLSGARIFTTRGCPYLCTFCANRAQKVRNRPIRSVIDEIVFLKNNYAIDGFYINDDTFCIDRNRTFRFLEELKAQKDLNMVWGMETRVNLVDEEMIAALKRAGCIQMDLGVESGSQEMLDRVKKGIRVEDVIRTFDICRRYRMRTFACFMVNMPGEDEKHINESIKLMKRIRSTLYGINITIPYIGTKIYEDYVKTKLNVKEYDKYLFDNSFKPLEDKRFRLVSHKLNEKYIYYVRFRRFGFFRLILDVTLDPVYWKAFIRSRRKLLYVKEFMLAAIYKFLIYPFKLLRTVNFRA